MPSAIAKLFRRATFLQRGLRRRFFNHRLSEEIELLVVSPGGVATTMLLETLASLAYVNDPYDHDNLKHLPHPPRSYRRSVKAIFVDGPDEDVVASLLRRGMLSEQCGKLGAIRGTVARGNTQIASFLHAKRRQKDAWLMAKPPFDVLCLEFEDIWQRADDIDAFLGLEMGTLRSVLPPKRARLSIFSSAVRDVS